MNSTKGKIGRGVPFFEAAFGKNIDEFHEILYMPETFIIYLERYRNFSEEWREKFYALSDVDKETAKMIIETNNFGKIDSSIGLSREMLEVLAYYYIKRE